jgi:hypothetical protein
MAKRGWGKGSFKPAPASGVSIFEAMGIHKGRVHFKQLQARLPTTVAQSQRSGGSGASGGGSGLPKGGAPAANAKLGQEMAARQGWTGQQWTALNNIAMAESGWVTTVHNGGGQGYIPGLAYGIPQALPGSKMASAGADWQTNPRTQIAWMLEYIRSTYGTPVRAWQFHLANGWY